MTKGAGARLDELLPGLVAEPRPERIDAAPCGPAVKHLAHLAMQAGGTPDQWRAWSPDRFWKCRLGHGTTGSRLGQRVLSTW